MPNISGERRPEIHLSMAVGTVEQPAPRNSPCYSPSRVLSPKWEETIIIKNLEQISLLGTSPIYSSNRSTEHLRLSNLQTDRSYIQESSEPSEQNQHLYIHQEVTIHPESWLTTMVWDVPETSPTHQPYYPSDTVKQNVINSPRHVIPSSSNNIMGEVLFVAKSKAPVTSATTTTTESDPTVHGPRITSLPPGRD